MTLPTEATARKSVPLASGVLDYFPDALAAVAALSKAGNDQHNPGQPLHWARAKSGDEADALMRHLLQRGTVDTDGIRHSVKVAWRALALAQKELESEEGAPLPRGAKAGTSGKPTQTAGWPERWSDLPPNLAAAILRDAGIGDVPRHPMAAEADRIAEDRL